MSADNFFYIIIKNRIEQVRWLNIVNDKTKTMQIIDRVPINQ